MIKTRRYVLKCQKGFLSENGLVEDVHQALQSVTREKMIKIHKDFVTYYRGNKNFENLIFFITHIDVDFPSPKKKTNAPWIA